VPENQKPKMSIKDGDEGSGEKQRNTCGLVYCNFSSGACCYYSSTSTVKVIALTTVVQSLEVQNYEKGNGNIHNTWILNSIAQAVNHLGVDMTCSIINTYLCSSYPRDLKQLKPQP
jgi:hypothetical protein